MDISDWLVEDAWYRLPDGTLVRATLEERDDAFRWIVRDQAGLRRFIFMDDGRVREYVREYVRAQGSAPQGHPRATRVAMVPCDLTLEDLQPYSESSTYE
jgi:hypothetical protein